MVKTAISKRSLDESINRLVHVRIWMNWGGIDWLSLIDIWGAATVGC